MGVAEVNPPCELTALRAYDIAVSKIRQLQKERYFQWWQHPTCFAETSEND